MDDLLTIVITVITHLLNGMIPQVPTSPCTFRWAPPLLPWRTAVDNDALWSHPSRARWYTILGDWYGMEWDGVVNSLVLFLKYLLSPCLQECFTASNHPLKSSTWWGFRSTPLQRQGFYIVLPRILNRMMMKWLNPPFSSKHTNFKLMVYHQAPKTPSIGWQTGVYANTNTSRQNSYLNSPRFLLNLILSHQTKLHKKTSFPKSLRIQNWIV